MSKEIKITKNSTNHTYQIKFRNNAKILFQSLFESKLLQPHTCTITDDYQTLIIKTKSMMNYNDFLMDQYKYHTPQQFEFKKYEFAIKMANDLLKQLKSLLNNKYTFYTFSLEELFVIDNNKFIYFNSQHLLPMNKDNSLNQTITLRVPFLKESPGVFLSPEIMELNELPFSMSYKTIYYSLGSLIIYFLFEKEISFYKDNKDHTNNKDNKYNKEPDEKIKEILRPIKETKLYWFLLRITNQIPDERWIYF
jgi:hypothetical protein